MKLILAPLRGHTDFVFRNALSRHFSGLDAQFAPFITTVKGKAVRDSHIRDLLPKYNKSHCLVPQLIGKDADEFVVLANQLCSLGYHTVNWNLGCPYPVVVSKKRGAGMLPYPRMIHDFLSAVIPAVKCRISIKTRLGRDDPDEILEILPVFNDFPVSDLIIHPRTARQMYDGTPNLEAFEKCLRLSRHPVVYNGDIVDGRSFEAIARRFGNVESFMIGRGVLMNPALPEELKGIAGTGRHTFADRLYRFHEDLVRGYQEFGSGEVTVLGKLKQLWCFLSFSFKRNEEVLTKVQRAKSMDKYWLEVNAAFERL